jgi:uncharacterized membrane protein
MEQLIPIVVLVVFGIPIALAIWLIVRAVQAKGRIEELSFRLSELEAEVIRLKRERVSAKPAEPAPKPMPAPVAATIKVAEVPPIPPLPKPVAAPKPVVPPQPPPAPAIRPGIVPGSPLEEIAPGVWGMPTATPVAPSKSEPKPATAPASEPPTVFPPEPVIPSEPIVPPELIHEILESQAPLAAALPPVISPPPFAAPEPAAETARVLESSEPATPPPLLEKASFEMRLGTFWLVRIGIVMLLTSLAFFANYAYHHIIGKLGPAGKISLLYLASGLLLGAGAWWQRRTVKESLKNYAQVLFAGGLAAVYFTTYAAHHIPPLRVIDSALLDGTLLLVWAGVIMWIAGRRKSEVMALFAVGLAFYSSVITRVGEFTLYSNLILTIAAVVFLVRNRWAGLSFASLVTSYAGYTFWRFLHDDGWRWATPDENLWLGAGFLASYWLVFTAATFLSRSEKLSGSGRAAFLTLNNGAFFTLFLLTMLQVHTGCFWKFSLGYGTVLLALAMLAQKILPAEPFAKNSYLIQGLLLVTLGLISKFSGLQLSLVLGTESVVLFMLGTQRRSVILKLFAYAAALLATDWCIASMHPFVTHGLWTGIALGAFMAVNAFRAHWLEAEKDPPSKRLETTAFTLLAFASWTAATWFNTYEPHLPVALMLGVESIVLFNLIARWQSPVPKVFAYLAALFAVGWCAANLKSFDPSGLGAGIALGLFMAVNAFRAHWLEAEKDPPSKRLETTAFTLLAFASWTAVTWFNTHEPHLPVALVLGVESIVLFNLVARWQSPAAKVFAYLAAFFAVGWCAANLKSFDPAGLWTSAVLGGLMVFNAFMAHRQDAGRSEQPLRAEPTAFTLLAFASWLATTWFNTTEEHLPLVLAAEAIVLTFSIYLLRVREITLLGQFFLVFAQAAWLFHFLAITPPWWNPLVIIAVTVGLSHWWQHQKTLAISREIFNVYSALFALAAIAVAIIWLHPLVSAPTWLALTSLLGVAVTIYGVATRAWPLAICGQIFLVAGAWEFFRQLLAAKPEWYFPLSPVAALAILSFATVGWFARQPESKAEVREPLQQTARAYRWIALAMSLLWIWQYVPERERVWTFMLAAAAIFALAIWRHNREALAATTVYAVASLATLWIRDDLAMDIYWPNLIALLALFALQQILRRAPADFTLDDKIHGAIVFTAGVSLWRFLSCWAAMFTGGFFITMIWAGFAVLVFVAGMILRERFHRWLGLGVLAAAVGRVVLVDVWKQETIYRVLTFMALGVALLVIGFIYNKYQEKIRQWL